MQRPLVSVITATYNRSNVLDLAIASVRWQTLEDWELIVVGDDCTDDTAEVVASIGDPRIRFVNLPENVGEQSGPNNVGMRLARGQYFAFLNHDDLWLPRHLEVAAKALHTTSADLVFTLLDLVRRDKPSRLMGATPSGRYEPEQDIRCSSWVFRRELADALGPWRSYRDCWTVPSQDWLFRAWRAGFDLRLAPDLTVVAIQSGGRPGVYALREDHEHRHYFARMRDEADFVARELTEMAVGQMTSESKRALWKRLALAAGLHPIAVRNFFKLRRRGATVDRLRQLRGLPDLREVQSQRRAA